MEGHLPYPVEDDPEFVLCSSESSSTCTAIVWMDHAFHVGVQDVRRSTGFFLIQAPCDATQVEDVAEDPPW